MCVLELRNSDVDSAARWTRRLVDRETRETGLSTREAVSRVAKRVKSSPRRLLSLLYEAPKEVSTGLYRALARAVQRELRLEIEALEHEMASARAGLVEREASEMEEIAATISDLKERLGRK